MRRTWSISPIRLGFLIIAAGAVGDTFVHATARASAGAGFSLSAHAAHFVVLVGMLVALVGAVIEGRRNGREVRH